MSYPLPPGWPRSRVEVIASAVVFVVGLVIIVSIRVLPGTPSEKPWTTGMSTAARDKAACLRLANDWAEFLASGAPRWDAGVDMSTLSPTVRDAFASAEAMSETRQRVSTGNGTTDELRRATDEAAAKMIAGCSFDPQMFDRIDRG